MTKLVRKLKQMAKKRSHRESVRKRKARRAERDLQNERDAEELRLEREVDAELARMQGGEHSDDDDGNDDAPIDGADMLREGTPSNRKLQRMVGGLVMNAAPRKSKKQLSRKQAKRKMKMQERGEAVSAAIDKKFAEKKRRVKIRAQVRNSDLKN